MERIFVIVLLGMSLVGCSGISTMYVESDVPGVADAIEPVMTVVNNVICNDKESFHHREAYRKQGIVGEGAGYTESCAVNRPK